MPAGQAIGRLVVPRAAKARRRPARPQLFGSAAVSAAVLCGWLGVALAHADRDVVARGRRAVASRPREDAAQLAAALGDLVVEGAQVLGEGLRVAHRRAESAQAEYAERVRLLRERLDGFAQSTAALRRKTMEEQQAQLEHIHAMVEAKSDEGRRPRRPVAGAREPPLQEVGEPEVDTDRDAMDIPEVGQTRLSFVSGVPGDAVDYETALAVGGEA
mmetsp:Transcript_63603/g.182962  ORF Transcript_63603/g.182962 Transcript_63603/m.182962 type:complete len:216 (+) Transcript_63603:248-895(+)